MTSNIRKSLRLMLTAVLSFAVMCTVVFAGSGMRAHAAVTQPTGGKLTVSNLTAGDVVDIYKLATMTVNDDNTVTNTWVPGFTTSTTIDAYQNANDSTKHTVANAAAQWATSQSALKTATATGTSVAFSNMDAGLYYVKVANPQNASIVYQSTLAPVNLKAGTDGNWTVATDAAIDLKKIDITQPSDNSGSGSSDPAHQGFAKQVSATENGTYASSINTLKTGDYAYFRISVSVPKYFGAEGRTFKVVDTLPAGVTYDSIVSNGDKVSVSADGQQLTFDLSQVLGSNVDGFSFVYKAKLTADAPVSTGFTDEAYVVFSPNSYDNSTTRTASTHTTINAANIKVVRADSGNNTPLAGATFELYSGTTKIATGSTNASGNIIFDTLVGAGTYTLKEIKAPARYGVAADTTVTITDEQATGNQTVTVDVTSAKNLLAGILPEAGGPGTIWLTIIGVLIVAGSIAGYVRTRQSH